ncbi:MAG: DUF997 family protein [Planctomycetales bacterium]|nr:DUF997 family protein [Planctomycetales bacterium]
MPPREEDALLRSARREAIVIVVLWAVALVYTVTYCALYGYDRTIDDMTFVFGFPDWVFWGVIFPWTLCTVFTWWFCNFFMGDEPLGDDSKVPDDFTDDF